MYKAEAKVQAALAFGGPLKPLDRQDLKKNKADENVKNEVPRPRHESNGKNIPRSPVGHRDGKGNDVDAKYDFILKGTKLKRKANGLHGEGAGRTSPQKKRSIAGVQPQQANKNACKPQLNKKVVASGQVGKSSFNPVFARSKQKVCLAADAIDLTTPGKKASVPVSVCQPKSPISSALPPVHILQKEDSYIVALSRESNCARKISHQWGDINQQPHFDSTASALLGSFLQQEDHSLLAVIKEQEVVEAGISAKLCQILSHHVPEKPRHEPHDVHIQGQGSRDQGCTRQIAYMNDVMHSLQHEGRFEQRQSDKRWTDDLRDLRDRAHRAAHELPWVHKYAPAIADQVVANAAASKELLTWLKQVEPIEAALTSMRSGQLYVPWFCHRTDSNAMSSWKADSDDSDFNQGKNTQQVPGVGGMIISGPHGCGKSAAVYACAQELGIQVLEINPGMDRTGAMLLRLIGEATQSHRVQWGSGGQTDEAATGGIKRCKSSSKQASKQKPAHKGRKRAANGSACPSADQPVLPGAVAVPHVPPEDPQAAGQLAQRSLLLFEDFDQLLDRDEGFLASVAALLNKSKIAVVLLSERPDAEAVLRGTATCASIKSVHMKAPSHASIIEYLGLVCACEEHYVHPAMLQQLAFSCNGDLRSALQQLQFIACQKMPDGTGEEIWQQTSLAAMPRHLAWIHAPAAGEPALQSTYMADGIMMAMREFDWACASLQHASPSQHNTSLPSKSSACDLKVTDTMRMGSAAAAQAGLPAQSQPQAGDHSPAGDALCAEARSDGSMKHEQAVPDVKPAAVEPSHNDSDFAACGPVIPACPGWLSALRVRQDLAAADVLDAWATSLQQRQQVLFRKRTKRRSPQSAASSLPSEGRSGVADASAGAQCQRVPAASALPDSRQEKDMAGLEDDMSPSAEQEADDSACATPEVDPAVPLTGCQSAPSFGSGSTREVRARLCRPVLDDSDEDDGGCGAPSALSPGHSPQVESGDEGAVTAAVVAEMVARCEDSEAVCGSPGDLKMQERSSDGAAEAHSEPAAGPPGGSQGDAQAGACENVPGVLGSAGAAAAFGSIAVAAAVAGLHAAAAAHGHVCGGDSGDVVPMRLAADVAELPLSVSAVPPAGQPKCSSKNKQKGSDGASGAPIRRGRPPKDTTKVSAAHAASRAAVVLQQGREAMSRHVEHVQRQAAELRSACAPEAPMCHGVPFRAGVSRTGMCEADARLAEDTGLQWASAVAEMVSASDVYACNVAETCSSGGSGMPGEWLWTGDDGCDEMVSVSDAKLASESCLRSDASFALERAEQAVSGVCEALWACCETVVPKDGVTISRPERSVARRMETVDRVRFGTRDCSRHSLFCSWHALGCMAHDECAAAAAQFLEGTAPRRSRRTRGHCAESVFQWDMDISEINAAALVWQT